jgi:hypothetical protein
MIVATSSRVVVNTERPLHTFHRLIPEHVLQATASEKVLLHPIEFAGIGRTTGDIDHGTIVTDLLGKVLATVHVDPSVKDRWSLDTTFEKTTTVSRQEDRRRLYMEIAVKRMHQ